VRGLHVDGAGESERREKVIGIALLVAGVLVGVVAWFRR
jgi:hypothetical protein